MLSLRFTALLALLALQVAAVPTPRKTFSQCELAIELVNQGLQRNQINDWVCLVEAESSRRTDAVGPPNSDGSRDYGLFQINSRYWCTESGPAGHDCNVRCQDLLDENLNDDVSCVNKIYGIHGFSAWTGWVNKCSGGRAEDVSYCF